MKRVTIDLFKMGLNSIDPALYVVNNVNGFHGEDIVACKRADADIAVTIKNRNNANKKRQYTNYYKLSK